MHMIEAGERAAEEAMPEIRWWLGLPAVEPKPVPERMVKSAAWPIPVKEETL
jgi:hypothetical protein